MLSLANETLTVAVLDPAAAGDRQRQGTRYCWGGYVWQVTDSVLGPLLAGPEWPEPAPTGFNGQGLPESFRSAEFGTQRPLILEHGRGFVIGIGDVAPDATGELAVVRPCDWTVTPSPGAIEFCTGQSGNGYACQLTRRVSLRERTLTSDTAITNTGTRPLPLHWFAHPFFALTDRRLTCTLPPGWDMQENPGFALDARRRISFRRQFEDLHDGHFEKLVVGRTPLRVSVSHPKLAEVTFATDFVPDWCPIWGNSNTWSIEPYITSELPVGARRTWTLTYAFQR